MERVSFPERQREEVEWHIRVHDELTRRHPSGDPNVFVWLHVDVGNLDADAAQENFNAWMDEINADFSAWLEELNPDDLPEPPDWEWQRSGLGIRLTAIPKKPEARRRGSILIGNPLPVRAWFQGEPWGTMERPL